MKKSDVSLIAITVLVCLVPMILGGALYSQLPEQMPIHFTVNDVPDNYAHKNFALFGIPLIMAILQFVCLFVTIRKYNKENRDKSMPTIMKILYVFIPIITVIVYILMLGYSLGKDVYIGKSICLIIGILFILMGNYTQKMDFKTGRIMIHPMPKDEKTFRKTIKITRYTLIILGIMFLVLLIFV